jgi:hypothetical protein
LASDQDLAAFVREHIRSVWALELLLALKRDKQRGWPVDMLVRELRASTTVVNDNLQGFERTGLAVRDEADAYRYAPASPLLDELCGMLEEAYRKRPVAMINLIARPSDPLQSLANAFKFRGDGK